MLFWWWINMTEVCWLMEQVIISAIIHNYPDSQGLKLNSSWPLTPKGPATILQTEPRATDTSPVAPRPLLIIYDCPVLWLLGLAGGTANLRSAIPMVCNGADAIQRQWPSVCTVPSSSPWPSKPHSPPCVPGTPMLPESHVASPHWVNPGH